MARAMAAAFVTAVFLLAGLNTGRAFAAVFGDRCMAGNVAEYSGFRRTADRQMKMYEVLDGITVRMPLMAENGFSDEVNQVIAEACDAVLKRSIRRALEYRRTVFAAAGKNEAFGEKGIVIEVDYEIKSQTKEMLSFAVKVTENWISASTATEYFNYNRKEMKMLTLADLLGSDYVNIADQSIREQMRLREESDSNAVFWTEAEGGFSTVDGHARFYVNENKNPVVVFEKYEIAPGAMGEVEFEIAL